MIHSVYPKCPLKQNNNKKNIFYTFNFCLNLPPAKNNTQLFIFDNLVLVSFKKNTESDSKIKTSPRDLPPIFSGGCLSSIRFVSYLSRGPWVMDTRSIPFCAAECLSAAAKGRQPVDPVPNLQSHNLLPKLGWLIDWVSSYKLFLA